MKSPAIDRSPGDSLADQLKALPRRVEQLPKSRLIVVGDVGLDEYVMGQVRRISPEAPVPVLEVQSQDSRLGLAANVAQNVASLGGEPLLVAVVGQDEAANDLRSKLHAAEVRPDHLIVDPSRPTTRKLRVMCGHHHIVRVDYEQKKYLSAEIENALVAKVKALLPQCDGVIIEDYAKGALSESCLRNLIAASRQFKRRVFIDPNRTTPASFYAGADVITPNREEALALAGIEYNELHYRPDFIVELGNTLRTRVNVENVVITRGQEGMSIFGPAQQMAHLPTFAKQVFDVTGAGDTVIAALALANAGGFSLPEACIFGNLAAGVVVGKVGCVPCTRREVLEALAQMNEG